MTTNQYILRNNRDIPSPDKLIFNRITILMYTYTNNMLPSVLNELYKKNNEVHTYGTCNTFRNDEVQKD